MFDGVAFGAGLLVEPRWPATLGALGLAAVLLVLSFRDRVRDSPLPQLLSGRGGAHRHCRPTAGNGVCGQRVLLVVQVEQGLQLWVVAGLTGGQMTATGRVRSSVKVWIFVVRPPRERPMAWSAGSTGKIV